MPTVYVREDELRRIHWKQRELTQAKLDRGASSVAVLTGEAMKIICDEAGLPAAEDLG